MIEMAHSVMSFGAIGDGRADDTSAFEAALASLPLGDPEEAEEPSGGDISVPPGTYRLSSPLVLDKPSVKLRGAGRDATILLIDHEEGPGVKIEREFCGLFDLRVLASHRRRGQPPETNYGIWIEPPDQPDPDPCRMAILEAVSSTNHPSHGIVVVSGGPTKTFHRVMVGDNGGHGIAFDNGILTRRKNLLPQAVGFADLVACTVRGNGGNGLVLGHPDDDRLPPDDADLRRPIVRVTVRQLDCGTNCADSDVRYGDSQDNIWIRGQDIAIQNSAVRGAISVRGINISIDNNRHVGGSSGAFDRCVKVSSKPELPSRGVRITDMHPVGTKVDPAVVIDDAAAPVQGLQVDQSSQVNITSLVSPGKESFAKGHRSAAAGSHPWQFRSGISSVRTAFTLPDDRAGYIEFATVAHGVIMLHASTKPGGAVLAYFRVGDADAHVTALAASAAHVMTTTGRLDGTTGSDGDLTVGADVSSNRLYVENRTGELAAYAYTLLDTCESVMAAEIVEA